MFSCLDYAVADNRVDDIWDECSMIIFDISAAYICTLLSNFRIEIIMILERAFLRNFIFLFIERMINVHIIFYGRDR